MEKWPLSPWLLWPTWRIWVSVLEIPELAALEVLVLRRGTTSTRGYSQSSINLKLWLPPNHFWALHAKRTASKEIDYYTGRIQNWRHVTGTRKNTPRTFDALELSVERGLQQHQCDEGKVTTGSDCSDKKVYNLFQQLSNTDQEKYWPSMRGV